MSRGRNERTRFGYLPARLAPITKLHNNSLADCRIGSSGEVAGGKRPSEGDVLSDLTSRQLGDGCDDLLTDRGDGPALAIIDRNARSLAQRVADETKEELAKVLQRVDIVSKVVVVVGKMELNVSTLFHGSCSYIGERSLPSG